jgi:hypothetical protein
MTGTLFLALMLLNALPPLSLLPSVRNARRCAWNCRHRQMFQTANLNHGGILDALIAPPLSAQGAIMTDKQPEALRLAEWLEQGNYNHYDVTEAAAELRRLHEVNVELVEALKRLSLYVAYNGDDWVQREAKAAIAKATGEQL